MYGKTTNDLLVKIYEQPKYIIRYYSYKNEIKSLENKCKLYIILSYFIL